MRSRVKPRKSEVAPITQTGGPNRAARFDSATHLTINADHNQHSTKEPETHQPKTGTMRYLLPVIAALIASPALAADKGQPHVTLDQMLLAPTPSRATCFVETSAAGVFLRDDRQAQGGAGVGCDAKLYQLLVGGGVRADFSGWRNTGSVFARVGVFINNGAVVYGLAEWKVPEWKVRDAGQLALGAGAELKLDIVHPGLWAFAEGTADATKFGATATKDDVTTRLGLRLKF